MNDDLPQSSPLLARELLQPDVDRMLQSKARAETVRQLLDLIPYLFPLQLAAELLIVGMAWNHVGKLHLIAWFCVFAILHHPFELWAYFHTRRHGVPNCSVGRWVMFAHLLAGTYALFWCYAYFSFSFGNSGETLARVVMIGFMFLMGHYARQDIKTACVMVLPAYLTIAILHLHRGAAGDYSVVAAVSLLFFASMTLVVLQSRRNFDALYARYLSDELAVALQAKNDEVMRAKLEVEIASQAKSRFFTSASHDLRQPLHVLSLLQGSLQLNVKQENVQATLRQMEQALKSLGAFFENVLSVSKLESGQTPIEIDAVPIVALFEKLKAELKPMSDAKNLDIRIRSRPYLLQTDRAMLERVLRNLISNAIKYTDTGGILLACRRSPQSGMLRVQVIDTGMGIGPDELGFIFEDFYQCEPIVSKQLKQRDGLGLGLGIVKRIAALLNHPIAVRSHVLSGTMFSLQIPGTEAENVTRLLAAKRKDPGLSLAGRSILIVDDDLPVVQAIGILLHDWDARVIPATSRLELMHALESIDAAPDFILADFQFEPHFDGYDIIRQVRLHFGKEVPAAIITGNFSLVTESPSRDENVHTLLKPVSAARLRALLHYHLCMDHSIPNTDAAAGGTWRLADTMQ